MLSLRFWMRIVLVAGGLCGSSALAYATPADGAKPSKAFHLPDRGKVSVPAPQTLPGKPANYKISLNKASEAELQVLPFVSPQVAKRIAAARPFRSVDELTRVPGIAPIYLSAIRPHVKL